MEEKGEERRAAYLRQPSFSYDCRFLSKPSLISETDDSVLERIYETSGISGRIRSLATKNQVTTTNEHESNEVES